MTDVMIENYGTAHVLMAAGLLCGLLFGIAAQHSRFCLRASVVEVTDGQLGTRFAIWLIAFCTAVLLTQSAIMADFLDVSEARQLAATGSLSGAVIGGLLFGSGMILARGCASRLLVLSATGNLRALVTGLILTLVAQASLNGLLATPRLYLSQLWTIDGGLARSLITWLPVDAVTPLSLVLLLLVSVIILSIRKGFSFSRTIAAAGVGAAVALGWVMTYQISQSSFDIVPVSSITFTGPSTDTLMVLVTSAEIPYNFGIGLVIGVFGGSALTAFLTGEWEFARFGSETPMERYIIGAILMGFGAMLAGGCAVGAGVSGSAVFSLTAWTAIFFMWIGAAATHIAGKSLRVSTI